MEEQLSHGVMRRAIAVCFTVFLIIVITSVATNRGIFGDGSAFLLLLASHGTFYIPVTCRAFANVLTQALPWSLRHLGVHDLQFLAEAFTLNLYVVPLISLFACWKLLRDKSLILFPLLNYMFATLQDYMMIVGESHVMNALFWPMFIIVLEMDRLTLARKIALPLLAFIALQSYESSLFLLSFLLALLIFTAIRTRTPAKVYWSAVGLIFISGVFLALHAVLHSQVPANEGNFVGGIVNIIKHDLHLYALGGMFAACFVMRNSPLMTRVWINGISLLVFAGALVAFILVPEALLIRWNHNFRPLELIVPFGLALVATFLVYAKRQRLLDQSWLWYALLPMASYCLAVQLCCALQWYGYQEMFRSYLAGTPERGVIACEKTPFEPKKVGRQLVNSLNGGGGGWTLPAMSVLMSNQGQVNLLIHDDLAKLDPFPLDYPPELPPSFGIQYNYLASFHPVPESK